MTAEQARELKNLRKQEAQSLKAITSEERRLRGSIQRLEASAARLIRSFERSHNQRCKNVQRTLTKELKPLRTQLFKLTEGRVPQASALAAIRKRIAILEGRLES